MVTLEELHRSAPQLEELVVWAVIICYTAESLSWVHLQQDGSSKHGAVWSTQSPHLKSNANWWQWLITDVYRILWTSSLTELEIFHKEGEISQIYSEFQTGFMEVWFFCRWETALSTKPGRPWREPSSWSTTPRSGEPESSMETQTGTISHHEYLYPFLQLIHLTHTPDIDWLPLTTHEFWTHLRSIISDLHHGKTAGKVDETRHLTDPTFRQSCFTLEGEEKIEGWLVEMSDLLFLQSSSLFKVSRYAPSTVLFFLS